jgi:hypothetical protein
MTVSKTDTYRNQAESKLVFEQPHCSGIFSRILSGRTSSMSEPFKTARRRGSRRNFLMMGGAAALGTAGGLLQTSAQARTTSLPSAPSINTEKSRPNILFIFTDQERYQRNLPPGLSLPAHERLQRTGVTFHNHYCPAVMCTSSRAVLLTGLQTSDNGLFENLDVPWVSDLPKVPTIYAA